MGRKKKPIMIVHWVTVRKDDTGELLNCYSFTDYEKARIKQIELEESRDSETIQTFVSVETVNPEFVHFPPEIQMRCQKAVPSS